MNKIKVNGYTLDEEQTKIVIEKEKYSLINAGAGSGKSLTLVGKVKYLLDNNIYKPNEICCISFTNASVKSLSDNITKNCNIKIDTLTFHKLALNIIKETKVEFNITDPNLLEKIIDEFFITKCFENKKLSNIIYKKFKTYFFKTDKKWEKIITSKSFINYKKTISTFIKLMQSNGYSKKEFSHFFEMKRYKNTLIIIYAIYTIYETEKNSMSSVDFDDMMAIATNIIEKKEVKLPYKFIIIDEFQDTSLCRFNLIKAIINKNDASLLVVGDDYQSIYRFSGCSLHLFLNFHKYFPSSKIYKLENTYRNSQQLINIAGKFIQKNKLQMKKALKSSKNLSMPIIICYYKNIDTSLESILALIKKEKEILIISRNNFDINKYTKTLKYRFLENSYIEFERFPEKKIRYMTIHSSKGLESDVVIILNVSNDIYGLPSKLKDENILSLVKTEDSYPYEEERRLFYVAVTRTKTYTYILTPIQNPSVFIREIKKEKNVQKIII